MPQSETTYDSEMNQPAHRPGMEKVVNRGADDARDSSGNREGERRSAAPPTRSAFGADSASAPAPDETPAPTPDRPSLPISGKARTAANLDTADNEG